MKVILGGTFDPVHFGHLRMATELAEALAVSEVSLLPCFKAVHKQGVAATAEQRLKMLELAVEGDPLLSVDVRELARKESSYTYDTLVQLKEELPNESIVLAMGSDAFDSLPSWYKVERFAELCHVVVMQRPGSVSDTLGQGARTLGFTPVSGFESLSTASVGLFLELQLNLLEISSSDIRGRAEQGQSIRYLLPSAVSDFICDNAIYQSSGG